VRPALDSGKVVLLDRFFLSTYAYQVSGRGLDAGEVGSANRVATGGLVPGITLLLSVSPGQGMARARQRGVPDRMELTGSAFHDRVASAFRRFGEASWQREHPECGEIVTIDASRTTDEVFDSVLEVLASRGLLAAL
jgi:dTMP kinase